MLPHFSINIRLLESATNRVVTRYYYHKYCKSKNSWLTQLVARRFMAAQGQEEVKQATGLLKRPEHLELTSLQKRHPDIVPAEIVSIEDLSPTIKGFTLQITAPHDNKTPPLTFKAGQWVDFFIPGVNHVGGFSMCSEPAKLEKLGQMDLAIKFSTWPPANWLHTKAEVGSKVAFRIGGEFHYPNTTTDGFPCGDGMGNGHDLLLVAGGVGINPIASIFFHTHQLEQQKIHQDRDNICRVNLLYSSRTKDELIFRENIEKVVRSNILQCDKETSIANRFKASFFVTQETRDDEIDVGDKSSSVKYGRIDRNALIESIQKFSSTESDPEDAMASGTNRPMFSYLCGPPEMIKNIANILINDLKVPKDHVFYEMWW